MTPRPSPSFLRPRWWRLSGGGSCPSTASLSSAGGGARSIHEGPDTVEELLERHLVDRKKGSEDADEGELSARRRLTSTRREALWLYRDIIRATRFFTWPHPSGVPWRDVLRSNARREFEEARFERDPEVIARLLIGGRDAVQSALDKLADAHRKKIAEEEGNIRGRR